MAKKGAFTGAYEALPKILKLIIQLLTGWIFSGIYRIVRFVEKGNLITLIAGLLAIFTGVGNLIFWWVDFITEILSNKITFFAD